MGKAIAAHYPEYVLPLTELFEPKLSMFRDEQRVVTMCMLASFMRLHPNERAQNDAQLLASLVDLHVRSLADNCVLVRQVIIQIIIIMYIYIN